MNTRYAIYYTPEPTSALAQKAACWLGRSPFSEIPTPQQQIDFLSGSRLAEITRSPRHYGFHGTLKPPFRLKTGKTVAELIEKLADFTAEKGREIVIPRLNLSFMDNFFCLTPAVNSVRLLELAAEVVRDFDSFREPAGAEELTRRRASRLTDNQERMLLKWGYPYVLDEFRFHLTLTGKLSKVEEVQTIERELQHRFQPHLGRGLRINALTLFAEYNGSPLQSIQFFPFARR